MPNLFACFSEIDKDILDYKFTVFILCSATLVFEVELVACRPRKGATVSSVSVEKARLE